MNFSIIYIIGIFSNVVFVSYVHMFLDIQISANAQDSKIHISVAQWISIHDIPI